MRSLIKKLGLILIFSVLVAFEACAGPSSVSVGVGVGVGVPRPYPGPPGATIWIGRPTPRTLYDYAPGSQILYYGTNDLSRIFPQNCTMVVDVPE